MSKGILVTGVAGFIGSNLLEYLLLHDQTVVGLDNYFGTDLHSIPADSVTHRADTEALSAGV